LVADASRAAGTAFELEALRKMTLLPAQRAGLASKGRLKVGADADITIFDPAKVQDQSTYEKPALTP
jgi:N-acyl-D-aspartate/D-glutamate deacylase